MSIRAAFAGKFGEDQAAMIEAAAVQHVNSAHDDRGSDPFKWAIAICIGYECMTVDRYRDYHGITADAGELKAWVREHGGLASHNGDVDYLGAAAGAYEGWVQ